MHRDSPEFEDPNAMNVDSEEKKPNDAGSSAEEDEEYEIEQILDAKRGAFANGRMGYFVKWKGYDATENSWVDEQDIGGAKELVEQYWRNNSKKGKRKSLEPKRARKSAAADQESDATSVAKKRGRKSAVKADSNEDEEPTKNKRAKKTMTKGQAREFRGIQDMGKYMDQETWEDLIDTVDTVERGNEGQLVVYFTLKTGENVREEGDTCRQRFPQQLLRFYESNLKWRVAQPSDDD